MPYNPFTLAFKGEWTGLESDFLVYYYQDSLKRIRIATIVAILLYGFFGILDAVMAPEQAQTFWIIRYGIVIPIALVILGFSFHKAFKIYWQQALFIMNLAGGLGIALMVMLADPPANYSYYAGIILVFIVIHTFIRLRFLWATATSWTIVVCYEIIAIWIIDTPFHYLVNNNFFFISSVFLCMLAGYSIELNTRHRFFSTHLLRMEKEKVQAANEELDQRVKERTLELSDTNQRLYKEMHVRLEAQTKRLELEKTLNQRQKTEAVGNLAGGIAHDFNNILAAIIGYTELIKEDTHEKGPVHSHASEVLKAAHRARELTSQILTFSRQAEQEFKPMSMEPIVQEALKLLRATIPSTVHIQTHFSARLWVVSDPTQIHRMIINLSTNSVQAMEDQTGILDLRLEDIEERGTNDAVTPGPYVKLTLMDTGLGMDDDILDQIFDPFFTTRGQGQGTGMGLAVVHGIVKKSQGSIKVKSTPGKGSIFTILLPGIEKPALKKRLESTDLNQGIEGKNQHILFVDDEPSLVAMMESTLTSLNYRVTAVTSAEQGLEILNRPGSDIDLVITDYAMPDVNGLDFSEHIHRAWPDLPIILSTGYSEAVTREKMDQAGIKGFIMKPLTRKALGEKIMSVLPEGSAP